MATVTMSGKEYKEILRHTAELERRLSETEEWLIRLSTPTFTEEDLHHWGVGRMPSISESDVPRWILDILVYNLVKSVVHHAPDYALEYMERHNIHYYHPFGPDIASFGPIDLREVSDLFEEQWEELRGIREEKEAANEGAI